MVTHQSDEIHDGIQTHTHTHRATSVHTLRLHNTEHDSSLKNAGVYKTEDIVLALEQEHVKHISVKSNLRREEYADSHTQTARLGPTVLTLSMSLYFPISE